MKSLRSLDHLNALAATGRAGSPLRAARLLRCAPSSIYRAIDRLEKDVGHRLFERSPVGWELTDTGREIVQLADRLQAEITAAELRRVGTGGTAPAVLRLSASDGLAGWFLAPVLAEFVRTRPEISIDLISDNDFADLASREADIAVRPDQRPGDDLVGRRAGRLAHALYGADPLLARSGGATTVADLQRLDFCALSDRLEHYTAVRWSKGGAAISFAKVPLVFNTETALASAISAGAGIGILPCFIGCKLQGVRRITTVPVTDPVDIWLVTHRALRSNSHVSGLMRHLVAAFRREAASFL